VTRKFKKTYIRKPDKSDKCFRERFEMKAARNRQEKNGWAGHKTELKRNILLSERNLLDTQGMN